MCIYMGKVGKGGRAEGQSAQAHRQVWGRIKAEGQQVLGGGVAVYGVMGWELTVVAMFSGGGTKAPIIVPSVLWHQSRCLREVMLRWQRRSCKGSSRRQGLQR